MKKLLTFLTLLTLFFGVTWAETATLTFEPTSKVASGYDSYMTVDGTLLGNPTGVTCSCISTYTQANSTYNQLTSGKTMTLTISGFTSSHKLTGIALDYHSNKSSGAGKVTATLGQTSVASDLSLPKVSSDGLNTRTGTMTVTETIFNGSDLVITVQASANSIFVEKFYITYEENGTTPTSYSVNLNQTTGGTISASPTTAAEGATVTLTATPNPGYEFTSWEVLDEDANEVTVTNNQFTMPASDVEVEATFTALQTYGITVTGGTASPTSAYAGQTVTVTPTIPNGKVVDQITTVPASLTLTASGDGYTFTMPDGAVSVTFTFKDAPVQSNRFERITSTNDLEAGVRYLLVYESETSTAVMGEITSSNTYGASVTSGFTSNNGVIVLNANTTAKPVTLGGSTGAWTFEMDGTLIGQTAKNSLKLGAENNNASSG